MPLCMVASVWYQAPCPRSCPACTPGAAGQPSSPTRKRSRNEGGGQPNGGHRESRQRFEPVAEQRAHSGWQGEAAGQPQGQGGVGPYHELPGAPAHHVPMQQGPTPGPNATFGAPAAQSGDLDRACGNPFGGSTLKVFLGRVGCSAPMLGHRRLREQRLLDGTASAVKIKLCLSKHTAQS